MCVCVHKSSFIHNACARYRTHLPSMPGLSSLGSPNGSEVECLIDRVWHNMFGYGFYSGHYVITLLSSNPFDGDVRCVFRYGIICIVMDIERADLTWKK